MTKQTTNKTLVFEDAGWSDADSSKATNVGNCRIRTAFTNDEGKQIYLEMGSITNYQGKSLKVLDYGLFVDFCFYITGSNDDCNISRLPFDKKAYKSTKYTKENITKWINENLNCSFATIEVKETGYRVHGDYSKYNLMDKTA